MPRVCSPWLPFLLAPLQSMSKVVYDSASDDPEMEAASKACRPTFRFLWRELSWEARRIVPGVDLAAVKVGFPVDARPGVPDTEFMWVSDLAFDGRTIRGTLLNQPQWATGIAPGEPVSCPLGEIADWMYAVTGTVCGAYTVNLMRSRMSPRERREHDSAWGLDFGDPEAIRLIPPDHSRKKKRGLFRRTRAKSAAPQDPDALSRTEHPMCLNMASGLADALKQHPGMVTDPDDNGWLMLHHEALAGNAPIVRGLLDHGADASATTPDGRTALDLAREAGWPNVVDALQNR